MVLLSASSSPFSALVASFRGLFSGSTSNLVILATFLCLSAPVAFYLYRYRSNIKEKVKEIEKNVALVKVVRNKNAVKKNRVVCMELDPNFVEANPDWKMMSFGEYLSQLEPADPANAFNQMFLQKELNILIGKFLLDNVGRTYGAALLPLMGAGSVAASIAGISNAVSKFMAKSILEDESDSDDGEGVNSNGEKSANDAMSFDLSLMEIISFVNLNQKVSTIDYSKTATPLNRLRLGENLDGDLAYDLDDGSFPKIFDLDNDFINHVTMMEERILDKEGKYDPNDRSFPPSIPINERLLPGLHLGKGDLQYTHTKREGIEHRLLCVLLNKLCHNYHKLASQQVNTVEDCFKVICNGQTCIFPEELIQALVDCGHTVEVCPRVILSNFGMQFCVKEDDGSFTHIPTTLILRTGIERSADGKPAYFCAPHGGLDLNIKGPLIGRTGTRPCWIQFYVSIGGLTCFHPDEDQDAPWAAKTSLADVYPHDDAIRAIRMCAIVAVVLSRIATDLKLPFGGYGVLGMCNDSATLIDFALRGETLSYPLLSTGRYLIHIVSYLSKLKDEFMSLRGRVLQDEKLDLLVFDTASLIKSTSRMPSDLHISPSTLIDTSARYESSYALSVFQCITDAKVMLREMANVAREQLQE
eukprot:CAMPEP_0201687426 /NCGR_PEP_ID=MMETSP0578-20130828/1498_1 /ASSEMBLY_ACC=CAM_ASM_000663 /TAXON_ID=267565 /ORGANISM="Skeletonema grethea, Strain CCMP 1804" /LENGTH=642 /DNA_ID=CAMNT_0048171583 /DNA_START=29 /DNA_END=1957 /DNA_ORIENTATION=+